MKECNKCKVEKPLSEYHKSKESKDGLYGSCKPCYKEHYYKKYYSKNKEGYRKRDKLYEEQNYEQSKAYRDQYDKKFQTKTKYRYNYHYHRRRMDPEYKLTQLLRGRFYDAVKHDRKNSSILDHLGCSIKEYKLYLEQMFLEPMNWDNHGDIWEIDHIDPVSKGGSWHYTNTQPLFKTTVIAEQYGYDMIGNKNKGARKVKNKL